MIASNSHGSPSLTPGGDCGQMLVLPASYLDLMFGADGPAEQDPAPSAEVATIPAQPDMAEPVA